MRLSDHQKKTLLNALQRHRYPAFLFGSRTKPGTKGGDVDILVYADDLDFAKRLALALQISADYRMLCDEKIDVLVLSHSEITPIEKDFVASLTLVPIPDE